MAHMISETHWVLPVNMIRSGDRVMVGDDEFPRSLVVESRNHVVYGDEWPQHKNVWVIKTQKHEEDWDWSKYDTYGAQPNDDYEGPEYIWPEDCLNEYTFEDWDVELEMACESVQMLDPDTLLPYRWWVNVYELNQGYGGPEEGGWWFTTGDVRVRIPCASYEQAEDVREWLREGQFGEETGRYPLHSVCYEGGSYQVSIDKRPGQNFPEHTPRYS